MDYVSSKTYLNSLSELLDFLDTDIPNDEIAGTLKKLFFIPAFQDYYKEEKLLALEYMKIVRKLILGELVVMFTAYKNIDMKDSKSHWKRYRLATSNCRKINFKIYRVSRIT